MKATNRVLLRSTQESLKEPNRSSKMKKKIVEVNNLVGGLHNRVYTFVKKVLIYKICMKKLPNVYYI